MMALPVLTALLFINISLGVITRAAPQLNIFAVGFPVTIISGLLIMFIVMPIYIDALSRLIEVTVSASINVFG
jgi:flagellar biosynthetic protein FliR